MPFCWGLPIDTESIETIVEEAVLAEQYKFDALLVGSKQKALDPWLAASHISQFTSSIRLLVAQNTNQVTPIHSTKSLSSLSLLTGGRVDINVVSGGSVVEIIKQEHHGKRYSRTREFVEILSALRTEGKIRYDGEYFSLDQYELFPKLGNERQTNVCIAGSSREALEIAAAYGDTYLVYANDLDLLQEWYSTVQNMAHELGRRVACGLLIDVIARETSEEAWLAARTLNESFTPFQKKMKKMYLNTADSVGTAAHRRLLEYEDLIVDRNLWAGLAQISTSVPLSIVGSYQEVIETIQRLQSIGAEYFIFSGMVRDREIERIGKHVLPYLQPRQPMR